ncbi:hypothetical protein ACWCP8_37545 [Streptomyces sp. NPDC002206]
MPEEHCARVGALTDADFPDGLVIVEDGLALSTRWVIHGKDDVEGEAGGVHPYYGLLERAVEESSVLDAGAHESGQADRRTKADGRDFHKVCAAEPHRRRSPGLG